MGKEKGRDGSLSKGCVEVDGLTFWRCSMVVEVDEAYR